MRLDGKAAFVTGGAHGIGEAVAHRLAEAGGRVVAADRDGEGARRVATAIGQDGGEAYAIECDVGVEADIERAVGEASARFGGIDVLVNNAGIVEFTPIESLELDRWEKLIRINLTSVALCVKHAVPSMKATGGGAIVNVSSIHASLTGPSFAAYAASKGGVVTLTRSMALELGPLGIRVNAVLPGYIRTQMFLADAKRLGGGDAEAFIDELEQRIPLRRIGTPDDVADVILFAASDAARYVTGASLAVDAGVAIQL